MKSKILNRPLSLSLFVLIGFAIPIGAQSGGTFEITKSVIAGGGGRAAGGPFTLDGTIGQSVAGTTSSGGGFDVTGGFWSGQASATPGVTVSGRVLTVTGNGLRNAVVSMTDSVGAVTRSTTSSFGVFSFSDVPPGQVYVLTVSSKRFRFSPQMIMINGTLTNLEFRGLE